MNRGRPVLGAISGFFFGLFLGITLLSFGILALDSFLLTLLPILGLVLGIVLGLTGPLGGGGGSSRGSATKSTTPSSAAPASAPKPGSGAPPT
jgi:hypothetical protein